MGVTIHFQGKLRSAGHMPKLQEALLPWAKRWKTELVDVDIPEADIIRVRNGKVEESIGRLRGCHVLPHKDSEPVRFWFTDDLYMESFCKTQRAPTLASGIGHQRLRLNLLSKNLRVAGGAT